MRSDRVRPHSEVRRHGPFLSLQPVDRLATLRLGDSSEDLMTWFLELDGKRNPLRSPPGGDRLPHIVRPRTRCERSELLLSLTGHGAESPLAAWLSRSFPRPLALRPAVT